MPSGASEVARGPPAMSDNEILCDACANPVESKMRCTRCKSVYYVSVTRVGRVHSLRRSAQACAGRSPDHGRSSDSARSPTAPLSAPKVLGKVPEDGMDISQARLQPDRAGRQGLRRQLGQPGAIADGCRRRRRRRNVSALLAAGRADVHEPQNGARAHHRTPPPRPAGCAAAWRRLRPR